MHENWLNQIDFVDAIFNLLVNFMHANTFKRVILRSHILENHDTPEDQPTNRRTLSMRICVLEIRSVKEIHVNKLQIEMLLIKKKCVDNSIASHIKYQLKWHLQRYKVASKCTERTERFVLGLQGMCTQREYVFYVVKESSISLKQSVSNIHKYLTCMVHHY